MFRIVPAPHRTVQAIRMITDGEEIRTHPPGNPVPILGVPFDAIAMPDAVELVDRMILSRKPHYIVTPNIDFVVQAQSDVELHRILFNAHLLVCDGTPLVWASRLLGQALPERVAGSDLVPQLIRLAAQKNYRLFLLGGLPGAAEKAANRLRQEYPGLAIDFYTPPFQRLLEMDHAEITRRIRQASPDILLVAFGCPKQEKWMAMHYESLGVPVSMGVGATVDFLAGHMKRAPVWMQRSGTEWIFRLGQEPRRLFRRYTKDFWVFSSKFLLQWVRMRCPKTDFAPRLTVFQTQPEIGWDIITAPIRLIGNQSVEQKLLSNVESTECHCAVDLSQVRRIDTAAVGLLVRLQKVLRARDRYLVLLAPGRHVRRALAFLSLEQVFHVAPDFSAARRLVEVLTNENRYPVMRQFVDETELWIWQGELTAASVERFMEVSRAFLASANQNEVVIDVSGVRFIDCSGAGLLAEIQAMAEREGVRLQFVGITASMRNVLRHACVNVSVPTGDSPRRDGIPVRKLVPPRPA